MSAPGALVLIIEDEAQMRRFLRVSLTRTPVPSDGSGSVRFTFFFFTAGGGTSSIRNKPLRS